MNNDKDIPPSFDDQLATIMTQRALTARSERKYYVVFLDMLGFSALTRAHPGSMSINIDINMTLTTSRSKSADRFSRFHQVLNAIAESRDPEVGVPSRMMIFSDCAFVIFDTVVQAALCAAGAMQYFIELAVPVRMGIAYGTCHAQRFSSDTYDDYNVTRAMFYGTGVVGAVDAEKCGGKGCRVFLHESITSEVLDILRQRLEVIPLQDALSCSRFEVCYLFDKQPAHKRLRQGSFDIDSGHMILWIAIQHMLQKLEQPVDPGIAIQYTETLLAINRMRSHLSLPPLPLTT